MQALKINSIVIFNPPISFATHNTKETKMVIYDHRLYIILLNKC